MRLRSIPSCLALLAGLLATAVQAQEAEPVGPVGGVPGKLPEITLPDVRDIRVAVPRPVRAAQAAIGLGRQRLALVLGLGTVGSKQVVDSAARDTQAVAAALRSGGFVVMLREDVSSADLRRSLKEFRERLQPGGVGFIYATGLGAQLAGRNLLLTREAPLHAELPPAALTQQLGERAVPVDELVDALLGSIDSPRMLVVDAAYKHPALAVLPQAGLAEQRLPPGLMALFGHALGSAQEVPAVAPLPIPAPTDPQQLAATPFARVLVSALLKPRISGPEALRSTRRAIVDATLGQQSPWLAGDTDAREEFAEATLLDGLVPRTPEEVAREAARQGSRLFSRPASARAGEQSVAQVLQPSGVPATDESARQPADAPGKPVAPSAGSVLGNVAGAVGTAASVATTVAAVGAAARAAELNAAASAGATVVSTASSAVGNAVALAARGGGGEAPAREAARQAAGNAAVAATPAAPPAPPPLPAAAQAAAAAAAPAAAAPALAPPPAPPTAASIAAPAAAPAAPAAGAPGTPSPTAPAGTGAAPATATAATAAAAQAATPSGPDGRTERRADGGERPAYVPRSNPFGYAEGDTFTYQVTDVWKGEVASRYTTAIEEVLDNGQMLANGQQVALDAQGRATRITRPDGSTSQFEPCEDIWWSKPERGQSRDVKFLETFRSASGAQGKTEWKGSTVVRGLRKMDTPAGEFFVSPIETSGWWYKTLANGTRDSGQWSRTVYYSAKLGHPVAIDIEEADRLGKLLRRERVELTHAQSARNTP